MNLGSFIREKRRAMNLTPGQLAERAGVGLNFVYQLEKNKPTVQLDCTRQVLQALGYDLSVAPTDGLRAGASAGETVDASNDAAPRGGLAPSRRPPRLP